MKLYRPTERGNLDSLTIHEAPMPRPQRGEVLVRVKAVSLNFRDLLLLSGKYPLDGPDNLVPTSDAVGDIADVGEGVRRFSVGDRVVNTFHVGWYGGRFPDPRQLIGYGNAQDGWLTEYRVVPEHAVVAIPDHLTDVEAATLPCAAVTAWSALGGPNPVTGADTVLTQGTGGVSLFSIQLARLRGARVIATTSSAEKADRLKTLGVDHVIDYTDNPDWGRTVLDLTGGRGVDRIVEVGGPGTFAQSLVAAGFHGAEIALIGFLASASGGTDVPFMDLFRSNATIRKVNVGSRQDAEDMLRFLANNPLQPIVDRVYPFDQARAALRHFASRQNFGKVVITV